MPVIALITDFGTLSPYVGLMKGEMLKHHKDLTIVDLTHGIHPQSILEGAFLLGKSIDYFPKNSIFIAVIDPDVGTKRPAVFFKALDQHFVGPNNGLFSEFIHNVDKKEFYEVSTPRLSEYGPISSTFHGRDVFSRVASLFLEDKRDFLKPSTQKLVYIPKYHAQTIGLKTIGLIAHIDSFGNLITNIPYTDKHAHTGKKPIATLENHIITLNVKTYANASSCFPFFLTSSFGTLEIAFKGKSAQAFFDVTIGTKVELLYE